MVTKKTYYVLRGVLSPSIFSCIQIVLNHSSSSLDFPNIVRLAGGRLEHEDDEDYLTALRNFLFVV